MNGTNSYKRWDNIIKSEQDKREYRGLELDNGMKVLLVSDPSTDKSAAAMEVNVGKAFFNELNSNIYLKHINQYINL